MLPDHKCYHPDIPGILFFCMTDQSYYFYSQKESVQIVVQNSNSLHDLWEIRHTSNIEQSF